MKLTDKEMFLVVQIERGPDDPRLVRVIALTFLVRQPQLTVLVQRPYLVQVL